MLAEDNYVSSTLAPAQAQAQAQAPVTVPAQPEPRFLRENWKAIIGSSEKAEYKFVRVRDGVGTVTNGGVLLRTPLPHIPDGFYLLNEHNELIKANASSPRWLGYPDVDTCCPPFNAIQPSDPVPYQTVGEMIAFLDVVRNSRHYTVVTDGQSFYASPDLCFTLPYPVLQSGIGERYSPTNLKMALTEMLRYPHILMAREIRADNRPTPLVLGHDWGRCALVMPLDERRYYHHH